MVRFPHLDKCGFVGRRYLSKCSCPHTLDFILFEGVRVPPNPGLSFGRGGLRSGSDGCVSGPPGMLGGQNVKKKLKKRNGSWKTAFTGSVSFRHRVCAARLAFTQIYIFLISRCQKHENQEMIGEFGKNWQTAASWSVSWRHAVCALLCDLEK